MDFLERNQIDEIKWNDCILKSSNGLVYGLTWFLDEVTSDWCAFVKQEQGCYNSVFPIPYNRKLGIKYVYPPFFIQQLGLFSYRYSKEEEDKAISFLKQKFKFIELNLNYKSEYGERRKNLVLQLNTEYTEIQKSFSKNHFRNLKKAQKSGLKLIKNPSLSNIPGMGRVISETQI